MVRQVGRPPERDSEGNIVSKCLVNVTIPTKLRDFLADKQNKQISTVTKVVGELYKHELCPKCYVVI